MCAYVATFGEPVGSRRGIAEVDSYERNLRSHVITQRRIGQLGEGRRRSAQRSVRVATGVRPTATDVFAIDPTLVGSAASRSR